MSPNRVLRSPQRRRGARGVVLIDVLIAVVVFAVGVLAVMALQATAVQQSSQAKYRADATMLANALISRMWLTDRQVATLDATFATGGAGYDEWLATVAEALPGAAENPPAVTVDAVPGGPGAPDTARVTVQLRWKPPSSATGDPPNELVMVTQIR
ncbi:MAG: type IV pilus modification protein PilV [Rubrivivax sp.]|nr:type IV pilus modification protein PilV [Rubrivivax sp.]